MEILLELVLTRTDLAADYEWKKWNHMPYASTYSSLQMLWTHAFENNRGCFPSLKPKNACGPESCVCSGWCSETPEPAHLFCCHWYHTDLESAKAYFLSLASSWREECTWRAGFLPLPFTPCPVLVNWYTVNLKSWCCLSWKHRPE